jgi:exonuclease SbcC
VRFKSLTAVAFGPFKDRTMQLAPGMTIVAGPNGAGKSSWHAALYAGLCGVRRGMGARSEDALFKERHQPWDQEKWEVVTEIELDNKQRVELRYDLDGRVNCSATDIDLGRDCSSDIMSEGTPDGSRFVGLDRRAFAKTACIAQTEILNIVNAADDLQNYLQSAAASAGRDATASAAISAIGNYTSENVGLDRKNSTKPLRVARETFERGNAQLVVAQEAHTHYLARLNERDRLENDAHKLERECTLADALHTQAVAYELDAKLQRAKRLCADLGPEPPATLEDDHELATDVAAALSASEELRPPSIGEDPAEISAELAVLPVETDGDTTPSPLILAANTNLAEVEAAAAEHALHKPSGQSVDALPMPSSAPIPVEAWAALGLAIVIGIAFFLVHQLVAAAVAATLLVIFAVWVAVRARSSPGEVTTDVSDRSEMFDWSSRAQHHEDELWRLRASLAEALSSRGYTATGDLAAVCRQYADDCAMREKNAAALSRKPDLVRRLEAAEASETQRREYNSRRAELNERLEELARRCAVEAKGGALLSGLRDWQRRRAQRVKELQSAIVGREELRNLLQGDTLEALESETLAKAAELDALKSALPIEERETFKRAKRTPTAQDLRALRDQVKIARSAADKEAGDVDAMVRTLPSVAEAKEAAFQAATELERIERLGSTLDTAREFLERAQEAVHRNIAPVLVASLEKWLPIITNGLYTRGTVDPQTLQVRVRSDAGDWRDAVLLSHGTAEQVYLLLRIAMVDHLTAASAESCPLLCDDITAHCDPVRTAAIMDLLHRMSRARQIIVFAQQPSIVEWAATNLDAPRDRIEMLDQTLIRA